MSAIHNKGAPPLRARAGLHLFENKRALNASLAESSVEAMPLWGGGAGYGQKGVWNCHSGEAD
jgi:hypothetical protein